MKYNWEAHLHREQTWAYLHCWINSFCWIKVLSLSSILWGPHLLSEAFKVLAGGFNLLTLLLVDKHCQMSVFHANRKFHAKYTKFSYSPAWVYLKMKSAGNEHCKALWSLSQEVSFFGLFLHIINIRLFCPLSFSNLQEFWKVIFLLSI